MFNSQWSRALLRRAAPPALLITLTALLSAPAYSFITSNAPLSVVNAYYGETQGTTTLSQLIATGATSHLTHLTYAFAQGTNSNPCTGSPFAANASDVTALRSAGVKVLISIGGENSGAAFTAALQNQTPAEFAHSCVTTLASSFPGKFDGIDVDWEFPSTTTDESNFNLLLAAFKSELATYAGNHTLSKAWLTAAIGPSGAPSSFGWAYIDFDGSKTSTPAANLSVDFYNVEFYNYAYGTGSPDTQSNAPVGAINGDIYGGGGYGADGLTKPVNQGGGAVPPGKIVLGIPFYGVHYTAVASGSTLGSTGTMDPPTTFSGVPPYYYIQGLIQAQPRAFQSCSENTSTDSNYGSAWTWNPSTRNFWEYDDDLTITQKVAYAQANALGGVFSWNLQHDTILASLLNSLTSTPNASGYSDVTYAAPAYAPNGIAYNRAKKSGTETYTITNTYCDSINAPIQLVLTGLPAGVTPVGNTGTFEGNPYWAVSPSGLASGTSAQVVITLSYTGSQNFSNVAAYVFSGTLP